MENFNNSKTFLNIFKGVFISVIFTLICLFVFSCLLVYTNLKEDLIKPTIIVVTGISILCGSSIANKKTKKNGILNGAIIGLLYILSIYIISSFASGEGFSLNIYSIIMMIVGTVCGIIGGIIGVNIKNN